MELKKIKIGVVDFFSGCGGASYGFSQAETKEASIEIVAGIDFDIHACATYEKALNRPAYPLDISKLIDEDKETLEQLISSWELHRFDKVILIGCAPCQGFSAHRKSIKGKDHRRSLFGIFSEIASKIQPDAIFMENVPDIFSKKHWPYFKAGSDILQSHGYTVRSKVYNFADFGLPQERFRAIMLAFKHSFTMPTPPLNHTQYVTVFDAIAHLPPLNSGEMDINDPMHIVSKHRASTIEVLKKIPLDGGNRPIGIGPACLDRAREKHGGFTDVYGRLAWKRPAVTITARCRTPSCGRFTHPEQHRGLSVREAALLQGFPRDFNFEGPFDDKYKQIGNAVPPLVAKHIAEHIVSSLMGNNLPISEDSASDIIAPVGPGFAVTINGIKNKRRRAEKLESELANA